MFGFTLNQILLGIGAVIIAFWPNIKAIALSSFSWAAKKRPQPSPAGVSYQQAMIALAEVRARMVQTGGVPEDANSAIEVITHALVEGSSQ